MTITPTVHELAYVEFEVSDLAAWRAFGADVLGMQAVDRPEGGLAFRMDDKAQRIVLSEGPADDLVALGFTVADDAALDAVVAALEAAGVSVQEADAAHAEARQVSRLATCTDPKGNRVELAVDLAAADTPFESPQGVTGFQTAQGGAGHIFLMCDPGSETSGQQAMLDFYARLGFRLSDYIEQEIAPGMTVHAAFTHCNGRHHTLAFAEMPVPKRLHHIMIEVGDISDVGHAYDRILDARMPLEMTLGMHPNDRMFSFYARTPCGFALEYGWGGLIIDTANPWEGVTTYDRLSTWGHRPPQMVAESLR